MWFVYRKAIAILGPDFVTLTLKKSMAGKGAHYQRLQRRLYRWVQQPDQERDEQSAWAVYKHALSENARRVLWRASGLLLVIVIDHPANAELVFERTEIVTPEHIFKRHFDFTPR